MKESEKNEKPIWGLLSYSEYYNYPQGPID
jgi:hypothetical protein